MSIEHYQATKKYKETSVKTADGGQLIVLLYEAVDKHLNEAITLLKNGNHRIYSEAHHHITKAQEIIMELAAALDPNQDKELYNNLINLYLFFNAELSDANSKKDYKKIEPIQETMKELLDAWREAASKTDTNKQTRNGINITG